jgi:indole-3-glycerol phosphate synthase
MEVRRRCPSPPVRVNTLQFQVCAPEAEPQNILEKIIWHKELEVEQSRSKISLQELQRKVTQVPPALDFSAAILQSQPYPAVIAEVKKASPSKGVFREDFDAVTIAQAYAANGAACLSVLTDERFFQGSFENLQRVREAVALPLLCKDFILHPYQIYFARSRGADAILLIAAVLTDADLVYLLKISQNLGMTTLMEVHNSLELERVLAIVERSSFSVPPLLGINNRNLKTFETSLDTTCSLLATYGDRLQAQNMAVVSESGIQSPEDLQTVAQSGAKAVLVGESLIRQPDPGVALQQLLRT